MCAQARRIAKPQDSLRAAARSLRAPSAGRESNSRHLRSIAARGQEPVQGMPLAILLRCFSMRATLVENLNHRTSTPSRNPRGGMSRASRESLRALGLRLAIWQFDHSAGSLPTSSHRGASSRAREHSAAKVSVTVSVGWSRALAVSGARGDALITSAVIHADVRCPVEHIAAKSSAAVTLPALNGDALGGEGQPAVEHTPFGPLWAADHRADTLSPNEARSAETRPAETRPPLEDHDRSGPGCGGGSVDQSVG